MSDNKTPEQFGEPVEEQAPAENVVERANEALANAEAARDEVAANADEPIVPPAPPAPEAPAAPAAAEPAPAAAEQAPAVEADEPDWSALDAVMAEQAAHDAAHATQAPESAAAEPAVPDAVPAAPQGTAWYDQPDVTEATSKLPESVQTVTELTPPAPREDEVLTGAAPAQPIFVQAPEAPLVRGNRGAAGAIGLLAAVVFAIVYLAARLLVSDINILNPTELLDETLRQISGFAFWTPVAVFFLAFWLLGAFINRGRWGFWVIFSVLVGLAAFAGHAIGAVLEANPWLITWPQAVDLMRSELLTVPAIVALIIGRELPVWFGAWIAARGRKMTALNAEAQEEYERTLEAGPQLAA